MEFSRISRSLIDVSGNLTFIKFGKIFRLVESGGFLRHRVNVNRNLRLVDLGRFPKF